MKLSARLFFYQILFWALLSANSIDAGENQEPIVIATIVNSTPFSFQLPNGHHTGLYVEFWRLWSETNNIPITFKSGTLEETIQLVKNNEAVHSGLFYNQEREVWADFSVPIHSVTTGIIYTDKFSKDVKLKELKGIRVATQVASFQADYLKDNFPDIELLFFDGLENGIPKLLNNEVDAIVAEIPNFENQLAIAGLKGVFVMSDEELLINEVHALVGKGQGELIAKINQGIENIPISKIIALEEKWLPALRPFFENRQFLSSLSLSERKWLFDNSKFSLGVDSSWIPFDFLDNKGVHRGISADYSNYIKNILSIELVPSKNKPWSELFDSFKKGQLDIISAIVSTPERGVSLNLTEPYFSAPTVIVARKDFVYSEFENSLSDKKLGLIENYPLIELVSRDYPAINIIGVKSVVDGLKKLQSGEIDAFINTATVINYEINNSHLTDLVIVALAPYKFEISMAVRDGLEPLVPILNKVFRSMSDKQKTRISNNWLAVNIETGIDIKPILYWGLPIISLLILIIIFIVSVNRRLQNEILSREKAEQARYRLEKKLHQSQKMDALGKLTGGIAHDFNNMLGVILGYTELLSAQIDGNTKQANYVSQIHNAGERGVKLTKSLLSFTQKNSIDATNINLNQLISEQQDMLQKTLTLRIQLVLELAENLWPVWLNKNEFVDAILNMSINAMHAMASTDNAKELNIKTTNKTISATTAAQLGVNEGDYVLISITDSGCGMDEKTKTDIFDPFFTTKGELGTGLGLSQVFGFIQRSMGAISVDSELGKGSAFVLYFPRYTGMELSETEPQAENSLFKGSESILIVDDERALLNFANELLLSYGYKTYCADNAEDALEIIKTESIDLLLSDVIMPGMGGYELAKITSEKYPAIKIQLVSGFAANPDEDTSNSNLYKQIVQKPYSSYTLLKRVRNLLDS